MSLRATPPRGFTLIELLSVIAIIGVLASAILASVGAARSKGIDSSVKQALSTARSQAELFYTANSNNYYSGVCTQSAGSVRGISEIVASAARNAGINTVNTSGAGSAGIATCHDNALGWAAEVPLKASGQGFFCVDSTLYGATTTSSTLTTAGDYACGP